MPDAIVAALTPATAAASPSTVAATPAAAPQTPAAAPSAPAAPSSSAPAAAGEPAKAAEAAKAPLAVVESLIGSEPKPADGTEPKPVEAPPAEPTAYDIKLPEGVEADPALLDAARAIFTEAKVAPEVAQKLATFHGEQMQKLGEAMVAKQYDAWNTTVRAWQTEITGDKELGGAKWGATKSAIEGGLQSVFGITPTTPLDAPQRSAHKAFIDALGMTGAGSNPAIIRGLYRMVSARSEGKPVAVGGPSPQKKSPQELFYPSKQAAE